MNRAYALIPRITDKRALLKAAVFIICAAGSMLPCGCSGPIQAIGLRAEYPEQRYRIYPEADFVIVDSLQPTLRWESFPRSKDLKGKTDRVSDVTYQIRISSDSFSYSRNGLGEPYHKIEVPLRPSTKYFWTVRACFALNGEPRCTVWGSVSKWVYWATSPPPHHSSSYRFQTPVR